MIRVAVTAIAVAAALVVIPGLTGLPIRPGNSTATAASLALASTPPTTPSGHTSLQVAVAEAPSGAGIATQGPATGMQTRSPLHSSAA